MCFIAKFCKMLSLFFAPKAPQHFLLTKCHRVVNGQLKLFGRECDVTDSIKVNGELHAQEVHFFSPIEVNGKAACFHCTFTEDILIRGSLHLKNSVFKKNMEIFAKNAFLDSCKVKTLYMTYPILAKRWPHWFRQKVYLKNKTTVNSIIFDKQGGIVYCSPESKVNNVENGTIKQFH